MRLMDPLSPESKYLTSNAVLNQIASTAGDKPLLKEDGATASAAPRYKKPANWNGVNPAKNHLLAGVAAPNRAAESKAKKIVCLYMQKANLMREIPPSDH
ncbi:hypothetical protein CXF72_13460 [Psychromonas sp. MB-3u-54]|nr:hypothetical protein CXF72_13460 [Psychromonas sp. MB-3u-54]